MIDKKFPLVKKKAEALGMSKDDIVKALILFEYADTCGVRFFLKDKGGLGMRKVFSKEELSKIDKLFSKTDEFMRDTSEGMDDIFSQLKKIFKK